MANTVIQLKKSGTPSSIPVSLANGELAINYADGKLFYKDSTGTIKTVSVDAYSTVNVGGTLLVADLPNDVLSIGAGDNITLTPDALNDSFIIAANLKPAFDVANAAFDKANSANVLAKAAFDAANSVGAAVSFPTGDISDGELELSTTLDAFGVSLVNIFDCNDTGTLQFTDLGSSISI